MSLTVHYPWVACFNRSGHWKLKISSDSFIWISFLFYKSRSARYSGGPLIISNLGSLGGRDTPTMPVCHHHEEISTSLFSICFGKRHDPDSTYWAEVPESHGTPWGGRGWVQPMLCLLLILNFEGPFTLWHWQQNHGYFQTSWFPIMLLLGSSRSSYRLHVQQKVMGGGGGVSS